MEEYGVITQLTFYVVENVCNCIREWKALHRNVAPISINISKKDLCSPLFAKRLLGILQLYRIGSSQIQLEITETASVPDAAEIAENIMALRSIGFAVALDDFGTGYASLSCLKTLPVDGIKVDRLFVKDIETDPLNQGILRSILDLARCMHLDIVYEGIETRAQVDYLRKFEFKTGQGYYYARPMPKAEAAGYLEKRCDLKAAR
ncbi:MAG: EAL domain-containing protein [Christensenellales bacterium]|jgi:EAL domain-containing protein (putative c-di-GMP-specific phosphodiesterase class I)